MAWSARGSFFLLFAAGLEFLLLSFLILAPGTILYLMARKAQDRTWLASTAEKVIFVVAVLGAIVGLLGLSTGFITI